MPVNAIIRLESCPSGYYVYPNGPVKDSNAALQKCAPCGKGEECTNSTCVTCSVCSPGFYKAAVSTEPCLACPANTYARNQVGQSWETVCRRSVD